MKHTIAIGFTTLLLVTACSSSGGTSPKGSSSTSDDFPSGSPLDTQAYATQSEAIAAACTAYDKFYSDLMQLTPHGDNQTLQNDASEVLQPLINTDATLDDAGQKFLDDATTLVGYVGSEGFAENATPFDQQITDVQDDCN